MRHIISFCCRKDGTPLLRMGGALRCALKTAVRIQVKNRATFYSECRSGSRTAGEMPPGIAGETPPSVVCFCLQLMFFAAGWCPLVVMRPVNGSRPLFFSLRRCCCRTWGSSVLLCLNCKILKFSRNSQPLLNHDSARGERLHQDDVYFCIFSINIFSTFEHLLIPACCKWKGTRAGSNRDNDGAKTRLIHHGGPHGGALVLERGHHIFIFAG